MFSTKYFRTVFYVLVFSGLFLLARQNYLFYHSIIEFFAIFTALSISLIALSTVELTSNKIFVKFGVLYFFVAIVDFLHMLSYKGMGVFRNWTANQPTQFWIIGRLLETIGFCTIVFFPKFKVRTVFAIFSSLSVFFTMGVWLGFFPDCFVEGSGLSVFKIGAEYAMVIALVFVLLKIIKSTDPSIAAFRKSLVPAIVFTALGEISFTLYSDVYGFFNFLGHVFRFISYLFIMNGVIVNSLKNPVRTLLNQLEREKQQLKQAAQCDPLTGLYNRNFFNEWIKNRTLLKTPLSFIVFDVDNFKQINDTYGHLVGDEVLKFIASSISECVRASDIVARYGGDEFVAVLDNADEQQAVQVAERIREKLKNSKKFDFSLDISYGIAQFDATENYIRKLYEADMKMYSMKKQKSGMISTN